MGTVQNSLEVTQIDRPEESQRAPSLKVWVINNKDEDINLIVNNKIQTEILL